MVLGYTRVLGATTSYSTKIFATEPLYISKFKVFQNGNL
jgi:hypothetical protein